MREVIGSTVDEKGNFKFVYAEDQFEKCMSEVQDLYMGNNQPQIDPFEVESVDDVLSRVLLELDLTHEDKDTFLAENYGGYGDLTPSQIEKYRAKLKKFIRKYRIHSNNSEVYKNI
jgi:hypothetical protein